jgi:hypothetical protein
MPLQNPRGGPEVVDPDHRTSRVLDRSGDGLVQLPDLSGLRVSGQQPDHVAVKCSARSETENDSRGL